MLDRLSGKILHIDFGDCFEVAMTREKFPEKIPFRLTRMLINAMEASTDFNRNITNIIIYGKVKSRLIAKVGSEKKILNWDNLYKDDTTEEFVMKSSCIKYKMN